MALVLKCSEARADGVRWHRPVQLVLKGMGGLQPGARMHPAVHGRDPGIQRGESVTPCLAWFTYITRKCIADEISAQFLMESVNRRILALFSKVLELPDNYL